MDSFKFLPRSFRAHYENPQRLPGEEDPVWAPMSKPVAESDITLLSSAGLYVKGSQTPFDLDRERREPTWGDPGWRRIPQGSRQGSLAMAHLHLNPDDILADHNVALPQNVLDAMVAEGRAGGSTRHHLSVMGYQEAGLKAWREVTAPAIVTFLRSQRTDAVVLAPS